MGKPEERVVPWRGTHCSPALRGSPFMGRLQSSESYWTVIVSLPEIDPPVLGYATTTRLWVPAVTDSCWLIVKEAVCCPLGIRTTAELSM